jgi:hypothetical protein
MSEPHRLRPLLFALVVLLGLAAPLAARPTAPEELVGQVQKKYQQLRRPPAPGAAPARAAATPSSTGRAVRGRRDTA